MPEGVPFLACGRDCNPAYFAAPKEGWWFWRRKGSREMPWSRMLSFDRLYSGKTFQVHSRVEKFQQPSP
jgi:hypothetical protein